MKTVGWAIALPLAIAWTGFAVWRLARLTKTDALKGDRAYDREGKFMLPFEYHDTESATRARQRRRSKRLEMRRLPPEESRTDL